MNKIINCVLAVLLLTTPLQAAISFDKTSYTSKEADFRVNMRRIMSEHHEWLAMYVTALFSGRQDTDKALARYLQSAGEVTSLFRSYYGDNTGNQIEVLFKTYSQLLADYAGLVRANSPKTDLQTKLKEVTETMSVILSRENMNWKDTELCDMLTKYYSLVFTEIDAQYSNLNNYNVANHDASLGQAESIADSFSLGIMQQFQSKFW